MEGDAPKHILKDEKEPHVPGGGEAFPERWEGPCRAGPWCDEDEQLETAPGGTEREPVNARGRRPGHTRGPHLRDEKKAAVFTHHGRRQGPPRTAEDQRPPAVWGCQRGPVARAGLRETRPGASRRSQSGKGGGTPRGTGGAPGGFPPRWPIRGKGEGILAAILKAEKQNPTWDTPQRHTRRKWAKWATTVSAVGLQISYIMDANPPTAGKSEASFPNFLLISSCSFLPTHGGADFLIGFSLLIQYCLVSRFPR
ncbi:uncharacterized protein LOC122488373 [Prionailurus bengalensis]|uniref:uncharacterized protein LOC122488373 n=1 Tax=Prionailurus bengalensis TaxID=37029 RepID=UPI001CA84DE8|nr:uncharacterized protein LOC122488373 [Prionailurus bengalensis]